MKIYRRWKNCKHTLFFAVDRLLFLVNHVKRIITIICARSRDTDRRQREQSSPLHPDAPTLGARERTFGRVSVPPHQPRPTLSRVYSILTFIFRMTVAVATTLADLSYSVFSQLSMDDTPDAPPPMDEDPSSSFFPHVHYTTTPALHVQSTTNQYTLTPLHPPTTQYSEPPTLPDPHKPYSSSSSSDCYIPEDLLTWGGSVSPDTVNTHNLSLYNSPSIPTPSPRPTQTPETTHTEPTQAEIAHSVSVTLEDLSLVSTHQTHQAPPEYSQAYHDLCFPLTQIIPDPQPATYPQPALGADPSAVNDWSSITGATVGLEGWSGETLQQVYTDLTLSSQAFTASWTPSHTKVSDTWQPQTQLPPSVYSTQVPETLLSPTSREVAQQVEDAKVPQRRRRSTSRSPLSSTSGAPSPTSLRADLLAPRSPLATATAVAAAASPGSTRKESRFSKRRCLRWQRHYSLEKKEREEHHLLPLLGQKGDEGSEAWRGGGTGGSGGGGGGEWKKSWPQQQTHFTHGEVVGEQPMDSSSSPVRTLESGGRVSPRNKTSSPQAPLSPKRRQSPRHTSPPVDGKDEEADGGEAFEDDEEAHRVCVPPVFVRFLIVHRIHRRFISQDPTRPSCIQDLFKHKHWNQKSETEVKRGKEKGR
ncbi:hypothetical protein SK128_020812 [Halocaridina rubra]|uniref:Uncharacterized protein n=1 Tax=Halocaridina rubra TaxID=373956 RepID=A0AAN8WIX5_HALRR